MSRENPKNNSASKPFPTSLADYMKTKKGVKDALNKYRFGINKKQIKELRSLWKTAKSLRDNIANYLTECNFHAELRALEVADMPFDEVVSKVKALFQYCQCPCVERAVERYASAGESDSDANNTIRKLYVLSFARMRDVEATLCNNERFSSLEMQLDFGNDPDYEKLLQEFWG